MVQLSDAVPTERSRVTSPTTGHLLDLRDFQDIVDEARRLIPRYCPEWTDHNVSDPGITLIELFAWMTEMTLYQLNRVPEAMYDRFLDLVGIQRRPPAPARARVTFHLGTALPRALTIPVDTEVGTESAEGGDPLLFTTTEALTLVPPVLTAARAWRQGRGYEDYLPYLTRALIAAPIFNAEPTPGDALYLCFEGDLSGYSLQLDIDCADVGAAHIDPRDPPLAWEYWSGAEGDWEPVRFLEDTATGRPRDPMAGDPTRGLNEAGTVHLHLPTDGAPSEIDDVRGTWIRVRYEQREGQRYDRSPVVTGVRAHTVGATVEARHAHLIRDETIGVSDGEPAQRFSLREAPVLTQRAPHVIEEWVDDEPIEWTEVADFADSTARDRHFTLDYATGTVRFGPFMRAADGTGRQHGMRPTDGATLRMPWYRAGGGTAGNVGADAISRLHSAVPYVASVTNFAPATGGRDVESIAEARLRARRALRATETAVTADDFARVALDVDGIGRAYARAGDEPGVVELTLVPEPPAPPRAIDPEDLVPDADLRARAAAHIDERKVLGTITRYRPVDATFVDIDVQVFASPGEPADALAAAIEHRLRTFFHPTRGGREGTGTPFGMSVTESQVAALVQTVPGIAFVERVRLAQDGGESVARAQAPESGLLVARRVYVLVEEE